MDNTTDAFTTRSRRFVLCKDYCFTRRPNVSIQIQHRIAILNGGVAQHWNGCAVQTVSWFLVALRGQIELDQDNQVAGYRAGNLNMVLLFNWFVIACRSDLTAYNVVISRSKKPHAVKFRW